jgi:NhaP-type Na+/H+ or K+/H+ antiporter
LTEELILGLATIIVLGISAQWLAWRLRLPSILLLLLFGFVAGPITHVLDPDELLGDLLFPVVSVSVAIILFEGGLSLKREDIQTTGHVVRNLVTVGALVTWAIAAVGAVTILEMPTPLALLFGAILVVTGPTVIIPLLRHVRAVGPISSIAKWEGIVNDPIGAILAVLVFEGIVATEFQLATTTIIISLLETVLIGAVLGGVVALGLAFLLRRYYIPDYLQSVVTLMVVVAAFAVSNTVQKESGLVTVTLMGIVLTNQRGVNIKSIIEFKENLGVLLLSSLFIILAARLNLEDLAHIGPKSLLFLLLLIFVARPASVFVSTIGSGLRWQDKVFLTWMAPRGIVAAAVTSVFALELSEAAGYVEAELMVPEIFLIIVGTVTVYGLSAAPLGRWLGVAQPNPQGVMIVGAHSWARTLASMLQAEGIKVLLVDTNRSNLTTARMAGLHTCYASVLSDYIHTEVELGAFGRMLALTHNDEVNSLAALHFAETFGQADVYQLSPRTIGASRSETVSTPLRGRLLFDKELTFNEFTHRIETGSIIKRTPITEQFEFPEFLEYYGASARPLFLVDETGNLEVFSADTQSPAPQPGTTLISLVDQVEGSVGSVEAQQEVDTLI